MVSEFGAREDVPPKLILGVMLLCSDGFMSVGPNVTSCSGVGINRNDD